MKRSDLIKVAKQEIRDWNLPSGLVLAILFCFIHRVTTGETYEETFCRKPNNPEPDYQI